jgi:hypothetical protein
VLVDDNPFLIAFHFSVASSSVWSTPPLERDRTQSTSEADSVRNGHHHIDLNGSNGSATLHNAESSSLFSLQALSALSANSPDMFAHEEEIRGLRDAFNTCATQNQSRVAVLSGEAQWTVVPAFLSTLTATDRNRVHILSCRPTVPYAVWIEFFQLSQLTFDTVATLLENRCDAQLLPLLADVGFSVKANKVTRQLDATERAIALEQLLVLLVQSLVTAHQPLVIVFKDAHWMDNDSLDGMEAFVCVPVFPKVSFAFFCSFISSVALRLADSTVSIMQIFSHLPREKSSKLFEKLIAHKNTDNFELGLVSDSTILNVANRIVSDYLQKVRSSRAFLVTSSHND